jgi:hypothetical protein
VQPAAQGAAATREELHAATPLRRPEASTSGSARLRTIKTAQRRLAVAGMTVATMLVAPQPMMRLMLGWLVLALVWATVPGLVRTRELAVEPSPTATDGVGSPGAPVGAGGVDAGVLNPPGAALRSRPR